MWGDEVRAGGEGIKQEGLGQGWGGGWDGDDGGDAMDVGDGMEDKVWGEGWVRRGKVMG